MTCLAQIIHKSIPLSDTKPSSSIYQVHLTLLLCSMILSKQDFSFLMCVLLFQCCVVNSGHVTLTNKTTTSEKMRVTKESQDCIFLAIIEAIITSNMTLMPEPLRKKKPQLHGTHSISSSNNNLQMLHSSFSLGMYFIVCCSLDIVCNHFLCRINLIVIQTITC